MWRCTGSGRTQTSIQLCSALSGEDDPNGCWRARSGAGCSRKIQRLCWGHGHHSRLTGGEPWQADGPAPRNNALLLQVMHHSGHQSRPLLQLLWPRRSRWTVAWKVQRMPSLVHSTPMSMAAALAEHPLSCHCVAKWLDRTCIIITPCPAFSDQTNSICFLQASLPLCHCHLPAPCAFAT